MVNLEVAITLVESLTKRDKYMAETQCLAGSALRALVAALSTILTKDENINKLTFIKQLSDTGKLIFEIQFQQTESRKAIIKPGLNKRIRDLLSNTKTDIFLFGKSLGNKIKETKAMEKLSQNFKNQSTAKITQPSKNYLNSKGPQAKRPFANQAGNSNAGAQDRQKLFFRNK